MNKYFKGIAAVGLMLLASLSVLLTQQGHLNEDAADVHIRKKPGTSAQASPQEEEEAEKEDGYARFAEFQRGLRIPDGSVEPGYKFNYIFAELEKSRVSAANFRVKGTALDWVSRGPGNIAGRTRALVVMPNDPSDNTWLAGAAGGGIWQTTNGGQTWVNTTENLPNLAISTIAVCLNAPNVVYAGSGEGFGNLDAIGGAGIFKSNNGGTTWTQLSSTVQDNSFRVVNRIIVDPNDPNIVIACANTSTNIFNTASSGIYKSVDGGSTWSQVYAANQPVQQLVAAPENFAIQYAAVRAVGVLKSNDAGATWVPTSGGIKASGRIELAVSPKNASRVAASVVGSLSGDAGADLYISDNGGDSWAYVSEKNDNNFDFLQQGDYDNAIMFHPFDDDIVYVAGVSIFKFNIDPANPTQLKAIDSFTKEGTADFIDFISFNGNDLPGLGLGDVPNNELVDIEIRFGPDVAQLAARFTVNKQGPGVPANQYTYRDYVEVPFQAWDITNNRQLMVSFRDQQEDGAFNLIASNTDGDGSTHSREYLYVHLIDYSDVVDPEVAANGGHEKKSIFNLWPVLSAGATWSPKQLPASKLAVSFSNITKFRKQVTVVADGYGEHTSFSGGSVVNPTNAIHVDHHSLSAASISAQDSTFRIIAANDGGVYRSLVDRDPGTQNGDWTYSASGMVTGQFYGVDKRPGHDQYIGGLQDNSTNISGEGISPTANSPYTRVIGGDGFDAIWNYGDDRFVIGSAQFNAFFKSKEYGIPGTWAPSMSGLPQGNNENDFPFFSRLSNSKALPEILFCVTAQGVYRSEDFGDLWVPAQMAADWSFRDSFTNVAVSISNPTIVWAGGAMSSNQTLQVSTDRGKSFKKVNNYSSNTQLKGVVSGLATHPFEDSTAFALFSFAGLPKVLRTKDLGATWQDLSGFEANTVSSAGFPDVAVYSLLVLPNSPSTILAGTEIGIFESLDDGASWSQLQGLPSASIWDMKVVDDQLVVATHGRGIFTAQLPDLPEFIVNPFIETLAIKPSGLFTVEAQLRSAYDSTQVLVNNFVERTIGPNVVGTSTVNFFTNGEGKLEIVLQSFKAGKAYLSIPKSASSDLRAPATAYANNFDGDAAFDFSGNGFSISQPIGFTSAAIHSQHSYADDTTYLFSLKTPIIINGDHTFRYRDIAIIETGEDGAEFGSPDFYDYVVVEGSLNGIVWTPIANGYDASANTAWLAAYSNTGKGTEALYVQHEVDLLDNFQLGDTVIFRFRLFADQLENAWGWSIDDLKIQTDTENTLTALDINTNDWSVYPNPVENVLTLVHPDNLGETLQITLINMGGQILLQEEVKVNSVETKLNLDELGAGLYLLNVASSDAKFFFRIVKR